MNIAELKRTRVPIAVLASGLLLGCLLPLCLSSCSSTQDTDGEGGMSGGSGPAGTGGVATGGSGVGGVAAGGSGVGGVATGGGGVGGVGGSVGGSSGTGWIGPLPPVCNLGNSEATDTVQLSLVGPNEMPVEAPVTASVTVVSVESCAATACPSSLVTTAASKIVLADASQDAGQQQWTLYLRNASMPANLIEVGGAFDLTVDASVESTFYRTINQTVVLARGGNLIVFAASTYQFSSLRLPQLTAFGIGIADAGKLCEAGSTAGGTCYLQPHAARVSVGDASALLAGGQTQTIGWLSLSNGQFSVWASLGGCDGKSRTVMAGFRL